MLRRAATYDELRTGFRWSIPARYNIGTDVCDRHAGGNPLALIYLSEGAGERHFGFDDVRRWSNRFANALAALGLHRGDRIGVFLPQAPETAVAHLTGFRSGMITVPLFSLFGPESARLSTPEQRRPRGGHGHLGCGKDRRDPLRPAGSAARLHYRRPRPSTLSFHDVCAKASDDFTPVDTNAEDPAIIIYTSGTTGDPKGALHAHRVLLGHLPGVELPQDFFPQPGDRFWTPADWAWIGGLFDVLFPAWHRGVPVVAHRAQKFDPEAAFRLMAEQEVRNVFLPPTAMKLMRQTRNAAYPGLPLAGRAGAAARASAPRCSTGAGRCSA